MGQGRTGGKNDYHSEASMRREPKRPEMKTGREPYKSDPPFESLSLIEPGVFEHWSAFRVFGYIEKQPHLLAIGYKDDMQAWAERCSKLNGDCPVHELKEMFLPSEYQIC